MSRVVAVIGAGPGLGGAVAVRFARAGYSVALLTRKHESVVSVEKELTETGAKFLWVSCDSGVEENIKSAFATIKKELGPVQTLVYNAAGQYKQAPILEVKGEDILAQLSVQTLGLLWASQTVLPDMVAAKDGVILVTSATAGYRANAKNAVFSIAKHSARALTHSIAREHGPNGVHAVNIRIDCAIDSERARQWLGDKYSPEAVGSPAALADTYFWLSQQPKGGWTNEIDLRPSRENWTC